VKAPTTTSAQAGFVLIRLDTSDSFAFQYFPQELDVQKRANWTPQSTTIGQQPLFYSNREPDRIDVPELILDNTLTGESLTPVMKQLSALHEESEQEGTPPPLLAAWGDQNLRCVLEDLKFHQTYFGKNGQPLRVRVSLTLLQLQPAEGETTSVRVLNG
jgi:phage protein U